MILASLPPLSEGSASEAVVRTTSELSVGTKRIRVYSLLKKLLFGSSSSMRMGRVEEELIFFVSAAKEEEEEGGGGGRDGGRKLSEEGGERRDPAVDAAAAAGCPGRPSVDDASGEAVGVGRVWASLLIRLSGRRGLLLVVLLGLLPLLLAGAGVGSSASGGAPDAEEGTLVVKRAESFGIVDKELPLDGVEEREELCEDEGEEKGGEGEGEGGKWEGSKAAGRPTPPPTTPSFGPAVSRLVICL